MSAIDATQLVLTRCRELGFALAGVCDAQPIDRPGAYLNWIEAGKHGEMTYMARNVQLRTDPAAMVPGAKAIICVADRHHVETSKGRRVERAKGEGVVGPRSSALGRIARYARGDDYHKVIRRRLIALCDELREMFPDVTFRACVDTAPVMERGHAQRAGLGAIGKHTLLIERGVGSYLLLGEIITTLALEPTSPAEDDPCGSCTRCIDACPTDAITPWSVDATKCISYLTIEHRGVIDEKYHDAMGAWVFGCDICQEVCPHNQRTRAKRQADVFPAYEPMREEFDLLAVLHWTEDDRRRAFARSAMKRAKLHMMHRNAAIAAGNALTKGHGVSNSEVGRALSERLRAMAESADHPQSVRQAARSALRRAGMGDR
ncbi:MAG TPA: tRNA epoxyqueuosine(34) reductase QueG [Gammaproteobacteria bacterium]|nr:tRNA epoxyqueuosine(34) reductase QueG [Gammaproteobacteria bacterium]